ncbi:MULTISPECIES: LamB/YcsF family protein [Nosocomiicoccus]|uniref:LamB/YcsF family protein n=1 Tax=Nosocomiicoccus TaxID=489909 RepID=UPI00082FD086|nr:MULTISPECIES: 5-oxoprolinase subunit PxpA [Nosocomiicoccus]MDK6862792.1 5-oxoprolinase subunit PxpA [Nosocomiicoccus ampullae]OFL47299.1 lactam utilization protein LamB [Nosocomiicoccus sp. HMSC067E10]OFO49072.1 lactam utilization protein LamB [Nosocomiicoccus sp. HMSC059G07]
MTLTIDLNADLGESFGNYTIGNDDKIIPLISSANVACGFHASDPKVMLETVKLIKESGAGLGAHPGFPDKEGFGRRYMDCTDEEIYSMVLYQLSALDGIARTVGVEMNHVKPHGALYNATFTDKNLARVIAQAVKDFNPNLKLMGLSENNLVKAGEEIGLQVVHEVFLDRAYENDGTLVSRRKEGAMITDSKLAVERGIRMLIEGKVEAIDGTDIDIKADSICVHGDGEKALQFVREIKSALEAKGIEIQTM